MRYDYNNAGEFEMKYDGAETYYPARLNWFKYDDKRFRIIIRTDELRRASKERILYLDEKFNVILTEVKEKGKIKMMPFVIEYAPDKQVYAKIHPKIYVPKFVQSTRDTCFYKSENNVSYHIKQGETQRIEKSSKRRKEISHFQEDTLYGYTNIDYKAKSRFFITIQSSLSRVKELKLIQRR